MTQVSQKSQPTMGSREIAGLTGKRHGDVIRDIRSMLAALGDDADLRHVSEVSDARGYTAEFILDRYHTEVLVTGYDVKRRAAVIKRWFDLESGAAKPVAQTDQSRLNGELALLECFCSLNNPAPSSRIVLLEKIGSSHGLDTAWLPGYAEDAPKDADTAGSMDTASLTALLAEHRVRITAPEFNKRLRSLGIIEPRTRKARKGTKDYWCVTQKGSPYGKNLTSAHSPRETQPHWYRERFISLLAVVGVEGVRA